MRRASPPASHTTDAALHAALLEALHASVTTSHFHHGATAARSPYAWRMAVGAWRESVFYTFYLCVRPTLYAGVYLLIFAIVSVVGPIASLALAAVWAGSWALRFLFGSSLAESVLMMDGDADADGSWDARKYPRCRPFDGKKGLAFETFVRDLVLLASVITILILKKRCSAQMLAATFILPEEVVRRVRLRLAVATSGTKSSTPSYIATSRTYNFVRCCMLRHAMTVVLLSSFW